MKKFSVLCLILALAMVMTGTARANYLLNPSMEDADPCDPNDPNEWDIWGGDGDSPGTWSVSYIEGDPTGAHSGEDYAELNVTSYGRTFVFQQRYVAEGIPYTLTAWAKASAYTMPAPAELKIEFYDWDTNLIYEEIENINLTLDWDQYTNDSNGGIAAPVGTRMLTSTGANLTDYSIAYYDDFDLTSNPDYASLNDCQKTQFTDGFDFDAGDVTRDCLMDLRDIARLAEYWTKCNARDCADYHYGY